MRCVLQLTLFLLGNRAPPTLIAEWYVGRKMLKDKSARDQVIDIIKQHKDGKLEQQGRTTWVMDATEDKPACLRAHAWDGVGDPAEDKTRTISTPTFAFDWEHEVRSRRSPSIISGNVAARIARSGTGRTRSRFSRCRRRRRRKKGSASKTQ